MQFGIKKSARVTFLKDYKLQSPYGLVQFCAPLKNFTFAYSFQIALEIMYTNSMFLMFRRGLPRIGLEVSSLLALTSCKQLFNNYPCKLSLLFIMNIITKL